MVRCILTVVLAIIGGLLSGCDPDGFDNDSAHTPTGDTAQSSNKSLIQYKILSDDRLHAIKRTVDVRLPYPIRESELRVIAEEIHATAPRFDRVFIAYWLPNMKPGTGAWATSHYDPTLEVRVLGLTVEDETSLRQYAARVRAIGKWIDRTQLPGCLIMIRRENNGFKFVRRFPDGSETRDGLIRSRSNGLDRFDLVEDSWEGMYFLIAQDGTLEIRDSEKLLSKAEAID